MSERERERKREKEREREREIERGGGGIPALLEEVPIGHGVQSASDDCVAPAPRSAESRIRNLFLLSLGGI